ncbi:hypothetical protein AAG570_008777 [Ranatra chinensis]|uniref:ZP domain-containing protein n=1 Tax=Ranatra chinensis TaxID=642074 RepID=A0ABD0YS64_9HEMI
MQGNSVEYNVKDGLPESTLLDGKVTKLDDISPQIFLNRTKASLNCSAGLMQIELKFDEPFIGIAYADFNRASACQVVGRGDYTARLDLPLKGCGTKQDPQRVFTNNIVVRFHPTLEMDGDEVITIVCRYPPPVAPPPALGILNYIKDEPVVASPLLPPLKGFQILLIICGILFLSLVLLGLGCSYYLLRRRRFQVVRRHPLSTGTGSEITKLSGSTLGNISVFEGLKIPRAHAPPAAAGGSVSGSEAALISGADTLPSDYPSESPSSAHSEVEDIDTRSLRRSVSSGGSFDNKAFIQDSGYMEEYGRHAVIDLSQKRPPPEPKFDVQVRVKKAAPPPPTPTPPPSESEMSMKMTERNLTTILEREEDLSYSTVTRRHDERFASVDAVDIADSRREFDHNMDNMETRSLSEMVEVSPTKYSPPPPPVIPAGHYQARHRSYAEEMESTADIVEPPVVVSRRPEIKSHVVDDVFLRTITEKRTIEDIERTRRKVTDYKKVQAPPPPPAKWDVTIRNYPAPHGPEDSATDWESYSETSSVSAAYPPPPPPLEHQRRLAEYRRRCEQEIEDVYTSTLAAAPSTQRPVHNWDILVRVLEPPQQGPDDPDDISDVTSIMDAASTLTVDDRKKWRDIITTESTLRTMLTEATVREDYERIRRDERYESLFEPEKWDGRYEQYDQKGSSNKYKKKAEWDARSGRRSSLPTLYEYDSDGGSSVRTLTAGPSVDRDTATWRRPSASSYRSEMDLRSMSEVTVDFARRDNMSDVSSYYHPSSGGSVGRRYLHEEDEVRSLARSASQPSLARSGSEFTEHWGVTPQHYHQLQQQQQQQQQRHHQFGPGVGTAAASYSLTSTSYSTHTSHRRGPTDWFGDNTDSEASYK